jgi:isopenicillin-N N-acyltransferase-like protein
MFKRIRLSVLFITAMFSCSACALFRIDQYSPYLRSEIVRSPEDEARIVAKARYEMSEDGRVRVLYVSGTPYERGFQHGALLRRDIQDNIGFMYRSAVRKFHLEEILFEAYERMRPFISQEYVDEMRGLAHGSHMPLSVIHALHALPSITEWGGKKQLKKTVYQMIDGEIGTSCSNFCLDHGATADGGFYTVRILDWGLHRISKMHKYPLITVNVPDNGIASANIGWVGFLGAVSGMNEQGITLGEMGYGDPAGEILAGKPMIFLLREVLEKARSLSDVRKIISESPGDCSYVYLMSDGKTRQSELYIRDKDRFKVFKPNERIVDGKSDLAPIGDVLYGGHYQDVMHDILTKEHGALTPEELMTKAIPKMAMPSNFQNVIYDPVNLKFWVANAKSPEKRAAEQPYTAFDLKHGLEEFRNTVGAATLH